MKSNYSQLNVLVIGLGSMGKRRIRNLRSNNISNISGIDLREDRRKEAENLYQLPVYSSVDLALSQSNYDAWIISVPPDVHHIYIKEALKRNIPAFIEASVVDTGFEEIINEARQKNLLFAPSCTLYFHPAIKRISEILSAKVLGTITNILYHSGQYLPDWHTYEKVSDYYVSKKETGGGREIVPFELTWLTMLLGFPSRVACMYKKTIDIEGAENIDDTYNLLLDYNSFILNLTVDVVSRYATRRLAINGEQGQLYWDWNENTIKVFTTENQHWQAINYEMDSAHSGYNKNITESMYNQEIESFLEGVLNDSSFPNTLEKDHKVLKLLYAAESSSDKNLFQHFS